MGSWSPVPGEPVPIDQAHCFKGCGGALIVTTVEDGLLWWMKCPCCPNWTYAKGWESLEDDCGAMPTGDRS